MTLDLLKIAAELRRAVQGLTQNASGDLTAFQQLLVRFDDREVQERIRSAKTSWLLGIPMEQYFQRVAPPPREDLFPYSCVATDGSTLVNDRHGPLQFLVVNVGYCILRYGEQSEASLGAEPRCLWREEDLWIVDGVCRIPLSGAAVSILRAVIELEQGLHCADTIGQRVVVLQDGTLIPWGLEGQVTAVIRWALERYQPTLAAFRSRRIPVLGFISFPGSREIVNVLRVAACDYPLQGRAIDCDDCQAKAQRGEREVACRVVPNVTDRWLFGHVDHVRLLPGERTGCFRSQSTILRHFPAEDQIVFFYFHTGSEIARVELPYWVACDAQLLDLVHAVIWDQCQRARGYPLALQEAHEQAVVRHVERAQVEVLLDQFFADCGRVQERSAKERSKRVRYA